MTNEEIMDEVKKNPDLFAEWLDEKGWSRSPKKATHFVNDAWPCGVPLLLVAQMWLDDLARFVEEAEQAARDALALRKGA